MSGQQKDQIGTWIYRAIIGAVVISMWQKIDRAIDLAIIHENEIKNLKEITKEIKEDHKQQQAAIWLELAKVKERQFKIESKTQ